MAIDETTQSPPQPILKQGNSVCFDSTNMFSELPPLKLQRREITDRGIVRFGSSNITSQR